MDQLNDNAVDGTEPLRQQIIEVGGEQGDVGDNVAEDKEHLNVDVVQDDVQPEDSASQVKVKVRHVQPQDSESQVKARLAQPKDSASQVRHVLLEDCVPRVRQGGSHVSNRSDRGSVAGSVVLKQLEEAATQASLEAKVKRIKERQEIERRLAELQRQRELLELQEALDMSKAREKVLTDFNDRQSASQSDIEPAPASQVKSRVSQAPAPASQVKSRPNAVSQVKPRANPDPPQPHPDLSDVLRLPVVEVKKFGGTVTEFSQFMKAFELKIGSKVQNPAERLYYLEQHMVPGSKPHQIVTGCLYLEDGYEEAMRQLRRRYGQPSTLASAFMDKILDQPPCRADDVDGLDRFAILLASCHNALQGGQLMDDPRTLLSISKKLPQHLIHQWRRKADDIEETQSRRPRFEDLVDFVRKEARVASNAEFGHHLYEREKKPQERPRSAQVPVKQKTTVAATRAETSSASSSACLYCNRENHSTTDCFKLSDAPWEEKREFVMKMALCFSCLKRGHRSNECRRRATCKTCNKRHPTALHFNASTGEQQEHQQREQQGHQQAGQVNSANVTSCRTVGDPASSTPVLPVVPVVVHSPHGQTQTYAFLDSGSTHSFISTALVHEIGIRDVPHRHLSLTTVDRDVNIETRVAAGIWISDLQGEHELSLPPLFTLESIPVGERDFPSVSELRKWDHLKDLPMPQLDSRHVGLLLGANAFLAMEPLEIVPSRDGSPYAVRTRFGWTLGGLRNGAQATTRNIRVCRTSVKSQTELERMVTQLYNVEYEENLSSTKKGESVEDREWKKKVEASIHSEDGHYVIGLPLAVEELNLPNNKVMAEKRLQGLRSKFSKNEKFADDYKNSMKEMIDMGYAEPVPEESLNRDDGSVWFLPHHAVVNPRKPDKIRVVFDCAAQYRGVCLNDFLIQGPDQTNSLMEVLLRFRMENIAFIGDIQGMFNQVRVPESDRDLLRFLWLEEGNPEKIVQYRMKVHLFGASSSPSVACYALRKTASENEDAFSSEAISTLRSNFYVDDVLKSTPTEEDAVHLAHELKDLCMKGGFNLMKFASNRAKVMQSIHPDDRSKAMRRWTGKGESMPDEQALGVTWETDQDLLRVSVDTAKLRSKPLTKRGVLSAVSSIYDPLGMVTPTVVCGRKILQELCKLGGHWDEEMTSQQRSNWIDWLTSMETIGPLKIQRCLKPDGFGKVTSFQLHHFSDASEWAYGSVTYARLKNDEGKVHVSFVKGAGHLAPLKSVTIPRLELMAAVTAVRVSAMIEDALDRSSDREEYFWTDSTTVLRYIQNKSTRYHTFVSNRLAIIHDGSTEGSWRFCPSKLNPADDVSRGLQSDRWLDGPKFLEEDEQDWPDMPAALGTVSDMDPEVKMKSTVLLVDSEEPVLKPMAKMIQHFSTWRRLVRALAWIRLVTRKLGDKVRGTGTTAPSKLSVRDLEEAEESVVRFTQKESFPQEVKDLEAGRQVRTSSVLARLDPFIDDGLLRVRGRLCNSTLSQGTMHPLILPSKSVVTDMIIADVHEKEGHEGRQQVMCSLRKKFWVLKANSAVRRCLSRCYSCRRRLRPPENQKMADLPEDRVLPEQPFARSGVDYFGPFFVKQGRSRVKRYGVIFTCLSMRAVHIEVADDLSSDSFICALRRFVARRGCVKLLRSDKGTNFVGANRELREELKKMAASEDLLHKEMLDREVEWKFNTAGASHHGGVWERHIRSIRRILDALIGKEEMKEEQLRTFLCEVENIINSRPLTPVSLDPRDPEPLTPNHLLLLNTSSVMMPFGLVSDADSSDRKRWKRARHLADVFWRRWRAEYVTLLQERPHVTTRRQANLRVGDLVLIVDSSVPRGQWPLGRVVAVKDGADGLVRSVEVKTRGVVLQRPVTKVVKLYSEGSC